MNVPFTGVVGVALRDLAVGNGGKAESCDIVRSGEGGPNDSGVVAAFEGFRNGDFRPLIDRAGDALRDWIIGFGEGKGTSDWRIESTLHNTISIMRPICPRVIVTNMEMWNQVVGVKS